MRLLVIVAMGGINAARRTSGFQSFRRMVLDALPEAEQQQTIAGLAVMISGYGLLVNSRSIQRALRKSLKRFVKG